MADINVAVIGSAGVGKSTLIKRAFGLRGLPTAIASSLRMSVDNVVYTVSLIEIDLDSFDVAPDHRIHWPKQINGHIVPHMDGALLLYDVMNRDSITELPQTLSRIHVFHKWQGILANSLLDALVNSSLPTILVSCKCDIPENSRQIDVESMEAACPTCVKAVKTAENVPESSRLCLSTMLRAVVANRKCQYFFFSYWVVLGCLLACIILRAAQLLHAKSWILRFTGEVPILHHVSAGVVKQSTGDHLSSRTFPLSTQYNKYL